MSFTAEEQTTFDHEIIQRFGDLKASGFSLSGAFRATDDPVLGERLVFEIRREDVNRGLRIKLLKSPDEKHEALTIFLEKGGTGGFILDDYLKLQGNETTQLMERLELDQHAGSLQQKMAGVLATARSAIDQYLMPALNGGEWPRVPMDWGDYK